MKVTGFTFIRNALTYDYPILEAIASILPLCDEMVVAVGASTDDTLNFIKGIHSSKIRIIQTVWDDSLREGGQVLAVETNKAFAAIAADSDWCFYIQGDEIVHECYHHEIRQQMIRWKDNKNVDGLLFKYLHFYGSYDYIGTSSKWYSNEIRIIKNNKRFYSYRDAQGFRKDDSQKLRVKPIDAYIYHYGWVKTPEAMQRKQEDFNKLWHSDEWVNKNVIKAEAFDYSGIDRLQRFNKTHPLVMQHRILRQNWVFDYDLSHNSTSWKEWAKQQLKDRLGLDFFYKNYIIV
jgi:hypothetical protein